MIRLALLSFWHVHAEDYLREAAQHPETEIIALWDEQTERGRARAAAHGWHFYAQLDELLRQPEIDGVIVTTATAQHPAVIGAALQAGKHVFTEKVLAATPQDSAALIQAAQAAGVVLTVALARQGAGYTQQIRRLLQDGALGQISYARIRLGHDGAVPSAAHPTGWLPAHFYDPAEAVGGALIDLGAHPVYLLCDLFGQPQAVSATFGFMTGHAVEDQAVALLQYPAGLIGVAEVSFLTAYGFSIEIHGTAGDLLFLEHEGELRVATGRSSAREWRGVPLPEAEATPFVQWVSRITSRTDSSANHALAAALTNVMAAAYQSAAVGARVELKSA